jgi:hypothetical protein
MGGGGRYLPTTAATSASPTCDLSSDLKQEKWIMDSSMVNRLMQEGASPGNSRESISDTRAE